MSDKQSPGQATDVHASAPESTQSATPAQLNYLDLVASKPPSGLSRPDQPLSPKVNNLFQDLGLAGDDILHLDHGRITWVPENKLAALDRGENLLLKTLSDNSENLNALSRGWHCPTGRGEMTWRGFLGAEGVTQGDMAMYDQLAKNFDQAAAQNPDLAKANAIFEFATRHFDQLSNGQGEITPATLQAAIQKHPQDDAYGKMLQLMSSEMPNLEHAEQSDVGRLLTDKFPSAFHVDSGLFGTGYVSQPGLHAYVMQAYEKATGAGLTDSYHADMVLDVRQELMTGKGPLE